MNPDPNNRPPSKTDWIKRLHTWLPWTVLGIVMLVFLLMILTDHFYLAAPMLLAVGLVLVGVGVCKFLSKNFRLNKGLIDSHYERFRRLQGLYKTFPSSVSKDNPELCAAFTELAQKVEEEFNQVSNDARCEVSHDDAGDKVHNLNLLFYQIVPPLFLMDQLETVRREYRDVFGAAVYEGHIADMTARLAKIADDEKQREPFFRAEATFLVNETRRYTLLELHVESTREKLMRAAMRSWWYNIVPFLGVLIFFLFCQVCIEHALNPEGALEVSEASTFVEAAKVADAAKTAADAKVTETAKAADAALATAKARAGEAAQAVTDAANAKADVKATADDKARETAKAAAEAKGVSEAKAAESLKAVSAAKAAELAKNAADAKVVEAAKGAENEKNAETVKPAASLEVDPKSVSAKFAKFYLIREVRVKADNTRTVVGTTFFQVLTAAAMLSLVGIAGASGGMLSVIQRVQTADGHADASGDLRALSQSESSVFFAPTTGVMFSFVLTAMFAGGVVRGDMFPDPGKEGIPWYMTLWSSANMAKWLVWSFLAGFSERLVPDMLNGVSKKAEQPGQNPAASAASALAASPAMSPTTNPPPVLDAHPASLAPNTEEITLTGKGFSAKTTLTLGENNTALKVLQFTDSTIRFAIPLVELTNKKQIVVTAKNPSPGGGQASLVILVAAG